MQTACYGLDVTHPILCLEWDFDKNIDVLPSEVTSGSGKKVWWKCSKGHSWQAKIAMRVKGNNCPICKGKKIVTGINDLATLKPELIKDWDYERNSLNPRLIGIGTHQRVWWKCHICGHQWSTQVHSRTGKNGTNCPNCSRR